MPLLSTTAAGAEGVKPLPGSSDQDVKLLPLESFSQIPLSRPLTNNLRMPLLSTTAAGAEGVKPLPGSSDQDVKLLPLESFSQIRLSRPPTNNLRMPLLSTTAAGDEGVKPKPGTSSTVANAPALKSGCATSITAMVAATL